MAEYYFDYQMRITENGLNLSKEELPVLHIERNYKGSEAIEAIMYLTIPQWEPDPENSNEPTAIVNSVVVVYDICGVETSLVNNTYRNFAKNNFRSGVDKTDSKSAEIKEKLVFSTYKRNGYRYIISNSGGNDFSGVGKIVLFGAGDVKTEMYCMVNFGFKKKISYTIKGNKVTFDKVNLDKIPPLLVTYEENSYPCLRNSRNSPQKYLASSEKTPCIPGETYDLLDECKGKRVYIGLANKEDEKYFLLECRGNDVVLKHKEKETVHVKHLFCPYCHGEIGIPDKKFLKLYKKGGVSCQGSRLMEQGGDKPVVIESATAKGKPAKNALYCAEDFSKSGDQLIFDNPTPRLLPKNFLDHDHFKVLVLGSKRSGKTTFLSRLFHITGVGNDIDMSGALLKKVSKREGSMISLKCFNIESISTAGGNRKVGDPWCKSGKSLGAAASENQVTSFYSKYSIDIPSCHFPGATDSAQDASKANRFRDLKRMPFVLEANESSYVYFYDMAGEDAQRRTEIMSAIAGSGEVGQAPVGVFYLIDKDANPQEIEAVQNRLTSIAKDRKVPLYVAVILTKFDKAEADFDASCHCLRTDVCDMLASSYEDSSVITNIDLASEEIRAYLSAKNIVPYLDEEEKSGRMIVKYFGVSSFSSTDAIFHEDAKGSQPERNYVRHDCSPKRMELPVLWMLHQFKCIY